MNFQHLQKSYIIAEAGLNHNGDIEMAKSLIKTAAKINADAIKFQIFNVEDFLSKKYSPQYKTLEKLQFTEEEWIELADYATKLEIDFSASVFDFKSCDLLSEKIKAPWIKIASGDFTYVQLINYCLEKRIPLIISTGMSTINEIKHVASKINISNAESICFMHCVSKYPTKLEDINLRNIILLKENLSKISHNIVVGFSDHTESILTPAIAVALGAKVIEKHFTLSKELPGPDHSMSLTPTEFEKMINIVRDTEKMLGKYERGIDAEEQNIALIAKRGAYASKNINKGEELKMQKIKFLRPNKGISPLEIEKYIGKKIKRSILEGEPIRKQDFEEYDNIE